MRCSRHIISESFTSPWTRDGFQCVRSARGPIEPLDQHLHCVACLGLAHAEAALDESAVDIARTCRSACSGPAAMWFAACSGWGLHCRQPCRWWAPPHLVAGASSCRAAEPTSPHSADLFPRGLFPPPFQYWGIRSFWPRGGRRGHVHLGLGEGRLGWIGARAARQLRAFRPPGGAHEGSVESCSGVVAHLESSGGGPVRSKLDSWYFRSTRKADARTSVPFFPDVHEQLVKTWSAPNRRASIRTRRPCSLTWMGRRPTVTCALPPVEETVAAHLCPAAAKSLGPDISLPSKPCRTTAHLR